MKRPLLLLILLLLLGSLAYWLLGTTAEIKAPLATNQAEPAAVSATALPAPAADEAAVKPAAAKSPSGDDDPTGNHRRRAYMLSLDKGALTFVEQQDIEGDFAPKRRKPEEWSGMLRCRLLSETNAVLAEELLPAPDYLCAVIDPKSGSAKPVNYTVAGPVTFQVRLPRLRNAARLDIYRIVQPGEAALEGLLGSIPLPKS